MAVDRNPDSEEIEERLKQKFGRREWSEAMARARTRHEILYGGCGSGMSDSTRKKYEEILAEFDKTFPRKEYDAVVKGKWTGGKKGEKEE